MEMTARLGLKAPTAYQEQAYIIRRNGDDSPGGIERSFQARVQSVS